MSSSIRGEVKAHQKAPKGMCDLAYLCDPVLLAAEGGFVVQAVRMGVRDVSVSRVQLPGHVFSTAARVEPECARLPGWPTPPPNQLTCAAWLAPNSTQLYTHACCYTPLLYRTTFCFVSQPYNFTLARC